MDTRRFVTERESENQFRTRRWRLGSATALLTFLSHNQPICELVSHPSHSISYACTFLGSVQRRIARMTLFKELPNQAACDTFIIAACRTLHKPSQNSFMSGFFHGCGQVSHETREKVRAKRMVLILLQHPIVLIRTHYVPPSALTSNHESFFSLMNNEVLDALSRSQRYPLC